MDYLNISWLMDLICSLIRVTSYSILFKRREIPLTIHVKDSISKILKVNPLSELEKKRLFLALCHRILLRISFTNFGQPNIIQHLEEVTESTVVAVLAAPTRKLWNASPTIICHLEGSDAGAIPNQPPQTECCRRWPVSR
jgi:hypothetical protein